MFNVTVVVIVNVTVVVIVNVTVVVIVNVTVVVIVNVTVVVIVIVLGSNDADEWMTQVLFVVQTDALTEGTT